MALSIILTSASTASILIITISSYIYYRLYLDPLAQFPGPALAALTRYYEAYYDVIRNGQYTFKIEELHKKYGKYLPFLTVFGLLTKYKVPSFVSAHTNCI